MVCDLLPVLLHFLAHFARTPQLANQASCRPRWAQEWKRGPSRAWNRSTGEVGWPVALAIRPQRGWISVPPLPRSQRGVQRDYMRRGDFEKGLPEAIGGGRSRAGSPPDNPTPSLGMRIHGHRRGPPGAEPCRHAVGQPFDAPSGRQGLREPATRARPSRSPTPWEQWAHSAHHRTARATDGCMARGEGRPRRCTGHPRF